MQTVYTVRESAGYVTVSVQLIRPDKHADLGMATIEVDSFRDDNSIYIPAGAILASESSFYGLLL